MAFHDLEHPDITRTWPLATLALTRNRPCV